VPVVLLFTSAAHAFMSEALRHDTLPARELARSLSGAGTLLMVNAGAAAPLLVPADRLLVPVRAEGDEGERVGRPAGAVSADRTDSSPEPRPHTAGRSL
jgi:hypothetical protein